MQGDSIYPAVGVRAIAKRVAIACALMFVTIFSTAQEEPRGAERVDGPEAGVPLPSNAEIMSNPVLRNALSRSTEGLVFQRAPDGAVSVDLQGRFQNVSVARIDADGEIRTGCVASHASLAAFLAAHPGASEEDYEAGEKGHGDDQ